MATPTLPCAGAVPRRLQAPGDRRGDRPRRIHVRLRRPAGRHRRRGAARLSCNPIGRPISASCPGANAPQVLRKRPGRAHSAAALGRRTTEAAEMTHAVTTLVLGGARSGKSAFAEQLDWRQRPRRRSMSPRPTAGDDEMRARIAHHRARRGEDWRTVEEPLRARRDADARSRHRPHRAGRLPDAVAVEPHARRARHRSARSRRLVGVLQSAQCPVVLVSNEVGLGLVPETPLGRKFRDAQGRLNQRVAAAVPQRRLRRGRACRSGSSSSIQGESSQ